MGRGRGGRCPGGELFEGLQLDSRPLSGVVSLACPGPPAVLFSQPGAAGGAGGEPGPPRRSAEGAVLPGGDERTATPGQFVRQNKETRGGRLFLKAASRPWIDRSKKGGSVPDDFPLTFGLIVRFGTSVGTTMATEEVASTELPEGAAQAAEVVEQPTEPPEGAAQAAEVVEPPAEPPEGAAQAAEVVEPPEDDQTAVGPNETLPSEGSEVEAPSPSEGTGEGS